MRRPSPTTRSASPTRAACPTRRSPRSATTSGCCSGSTTSRPSSATTGARCASTTRWLHRAGIVWGLDVELVDDKREIAVEPGLALDPAGRELHLDVRCCMDIAAWFDEHADERRARDERRRLDRVRRARRARVLRVRDAAGAGDRRPVRGRGRRHRVLADVRDGRASASSPSSPSRCRRRTRGCGSCSASTTACRPTSTTVRTWSPRAPTVLALAPEDQPGKLLEYFRDFADLDTARDGAGGRARRRAAAQLSPAPTTRASCSRT